MLFSSETGTDASLEAVSAAASTLAVIEKTASSFEISPASAFPISSFTSLRYSAADSISDFLTDISSPAPRTGKLSSREL